MLILKIHFIVFLLFDFPVFFPSLLLHPPLFSSSSHFLLSSSTWLDFITLLLLGLLGKGGREAD